MRFFFDRCVPLLIAKMISAYEGASLTLVHHDEDGRFREDTQDVEWMRVLRADGEPSWIIVSGDGRILRNRAERAVLNEVGLPFFCLDSPWPRMAKHEYACNFLRVWPKIVAHATLQTRGSIFKVGAGKGLKIDQVQ